MPVALQGRHPCKPGSSFQAFSDEHATHRRVAGGIVLHPVIPFDLVRLDPDLPRQLSVSVDDTNRLDAQLDPIGCLHPDAWVGVRDAVKHPLVFDGDTYRRCTAVDSPEQLPVAFDQVRFEMQSTRPLYLGVEIIDMFFCNRVDLLDHSRGRLRDGPRSGAQLQRVCTSRYRDDYHEDGKRSAHQPEDEGRDHIPDRPHSGAHPLSGSRLDQRCESSDNGHEDPDNTDQGDGPRPGSRLDRRTDCNTRRVLGAGRVTNAAAGVADLVGAAFGEDGRLLLKVFIGERCRHRWRLALQN